MKNSIFILAALLVMSCTVDLTVKYPFDAKNSTQYTVDIDSGMDQLNAAIQSQTKGVVSGKVASSGQIPAEFGNSYTIQTQLTLDNMFQFLSGNEVSLTIAVTGHTPAGDINKNTNIVFSICDFKDLTGQPLTFTQPGVVMEIKNYNEFCGANGVKQDKSKRPNLYIVQENEPMQIKLSEEKDLKDYTKYMNKIYAATINKLSLVINTVPDGFAFGECTKTTETCVTINAELFAQAIQKDGTKNADGTDHFAGIDEDSNYDNYFDSTKRDKYWIGIFGTQNFKSGGSLDLEYTYDGREILQKAIKKLDFQIGIKSYYTIVPGANRPRGKFISEVSGEFFFSVAPLN